MSLSDIKIDICPYDEAYFNDLLDIWNDIIVNEECFMYETPFTPEEFRELLNSRNIIRCAVSMGKALGFYMMHANFPGKGSHVANASYAVGRNYRKLGTGGTLARDSIAQAAKNGYTAMQFNAVASLNLGAISLWQKLGFSRVGEIPYAYRTKHGEKITVYVFYKSIL